MKYHSLPAAAVIAAGVIAALHVGKIPPAIPVLQQALGLTLVEAGFLLSMVQLAGMLLGVLLGLAADGLGLRRSMLVGQLTLGMASLAGIWARAPVDLLVLRAVEGLGFLLVVLAAPSLIRQLVPPRQLSPFLGLWGAYMPAGTALALLGGPLFMAAWGWQAWWGLLGALSLAMAAWLVRGVPDDRKPASPAPAHAAAGWRRNLRLTLASPGPWLVALAFAM
ncbi:MAG: MFS transporter [Comamonas sp.]